MIARIIVITVFLFFTWKGSLLAMDREVVVYTSVDHLFSEPLLKDFEKKYNIKVRAVYDIEAVKSAGLVNRLIAEKSNPRCDVFWNSEIIRTIILKKKGVLAPYHSRLSMDIPEQYKDNEGYWIGFVGRLRVFVVNTNLVSEDDYPSSLQDLLLPKWFGKVAMANPLFGTTGTHVASIYLLLGESKTRALFSGLVKNEIQIVDGNSVVRDMVGSGELPIGLTDTDDVQVGLSSGLPIKAILPVHDGFSPLLIPHTVSLIAGGPNPDEGKLLIDYLLSAEVAQQLMESGAAQVPLRKNVKKPATWRDAGDVSDFNHDYKAMEQHMQKALKIAQSYFIR